MELSDIGSIYMAKVPQHHIRCEIRKILNRIRRKNNLCCVTQAQ